MKECPVMEGRVLSIECEFVSQLLSIGVIECGGVCLTVYVFVVVVMSEGTEGKSAAIPVS